MPRDPLFVSGPKTRVKVCGLKDVDAARAALKAGADFIGFVFYEKSPRYIAPKQVSDILDTLRKEFPREWVRPVGVFVQTAIEDVWAAASYLRLTAVQLHGDEDLDYVRRVKDVWNVIRAVRVKDAQSLEGLDEYCEPTSAFLFDAHSTSAYGGTGTTYPYELVRSWIKRHAVLIAGGLRPDTVGPLVRSLRPYGVDVSSGVESSPGVKDHGKIRAFIDEVRRVDLERLGKGERADPDLDPIERAISDEPGSARDPSFGRPDSSKG